MRIETARAGKTVNDLLKLLVKARSELRNIIDSDNYTSAVEEVFDIDAVEDLVSSISNAVGGSPTSYPGIFLFVPFSDIKFIAPTLSDSNICTVMQNVVIGFNPEDGLSNDVLRYYVNQAKKDIADAQEELP